MVKILRILKVEICQVEEDIPPSDLPPGLTLVGSSVAKISSEATQTVLLARLGILSRKGKRREAEYEENGSIALCYISQTKMRTLASDNGSW